MQYNRYVKEVVTAVPVRALKTVPQVISTDWPKEKTRFCGSLCAHIQIFTETTVMQLGGELIEVSVPSELNRSP